MKRGVVIANCAVRSPTFSTYLLASFHLAHHPLDPADQIRHKHLALWYGRKDPKVMRQALIVIALDGHARLLQTRLHDFPVVAQRVRLARHDVGGRVVFVVVGRERGEGRGVGRIDVERGVEGVHGRFVDDGHVFCVGRVGRVAGGVFGGDVRPV